MICEKCPNNIQGTCTTAQKVAKYDRDVLLQCNLAVGMILPFAEFQARVRENILCAGKQESICGNCQWNDICF